MKGLLTLISVVYIISFVFSGHAHEGHSMPVYTNSLDFDLTDEISALSVGPVLSQAIGKMKTLEDFHNVRGLIARYKEIYKTLPPLQKSLVCESLKLMSIKELTEMADFLSTGYHRKVSQSDADLLGLECQNELVEKINAFWEEKRKKTIETLGLPLEESSGSLTVVEYEVPEGSYLDGISSQAHRLPKGHFALTFDDGPHATRTHKVLASLNHYNAKATFFMVGKRAKEYESIAQDVRGELHSVGSHSYDHTNMRKVPHIKAVNNITDGHSYVDEAVHNESFLFFRFPYGAHTSRLRNELPKIPLSEFFWNVDTMDWATHDPVELFKNTMKIMAEEGRGIVLMHDIQEQTAIALPYILEEMKNRGYKLVVFKPQSDL